MTTVSEAEYRAGRARLVDVREERRGAGRFEFRENKNTGTVVLEGYASTFDSYDVHGGPQAGGWVEQLASTAFDRTLREMPDVQLLINHEGLPLARTKSGNLKLSRDRHGLLVRAELDPSDPDVQRLIPKMRRGDMDEMSFAFRVKDQTWDSTYTHRTINDLTLEKGDVSIVNYGMNPATRATLTADAIGTLAQLSNSDLVEARGLSADKIARAQAVLNRLNPGGVKRAKGGSPKQPYGNVTYADPGYQSDGKKRYPLDTEDHARSAWSYINMPKNQKKYSAAQVNQIKSRIRGALKKFGVKTDSEGKSAVKLDRIATRTSADGTTSLVAVMDDGTRVPLPSENPQLREGKFSGTPVADWHPSDSNCDPHDDEFETGDGLTPPSFGPVPENITGGSMQGTPAFKHPSPQGNPHDTSTQKEMYGQSAPDHHNDPRITGPSDTGPHSSHLTGNNGGNDDPHNTPYDVGKQVGNVPMDKPNYGDFPQGKVADNIHRTEALYEWPDHAVRGEGIWDWTDGPISEPCDPDENLDRPVDQPDSPAWQAGERPPVGAKHDRGIGVGDDGAGHKVAVHGEAAYDPETGEGRVMDDDKDDDKEKDCDRTFSSAVAEALDRTITHAYQLAQGNEQLRKLLSQAHYQLEELRGVKPRSKDTDVARKLAELRMEVGSPDTQTVSGGLQWLRSAGSTPVGYRGAVQQDPDAHVVTAAERLAHAKAAEARKSAEAAGDADEKLRLARREAELNDVIRRKHATEARVGRVGPFPGDHAGRSR